MNDVLPLPRLILRVGGLGNRNFGQKNGVAEDGNQILEAAQRKCEEVCAELEQILQSIVAEECPGPTHSHTPESPSWWQTNLLAGLFFLQPDRWGMWKKRGVPLGVFRDEPPLIQILTGGEVGGDQLIRDTGLARNGQGVTVRYEHLSIAPVAPTDPSVAGGLGVGGKPEKPKELADREKAGAPLLRAEAEQLATISRQRAYAFRAQAEALRHHSDLLLAIWDPSTAGKAGGTEESVAIALHEGIPVVALRVRSEHKVDIDVLVKPSDLHCVRHAATDWKVQLNRVVRNSVCFPDSPVDHQDHHEPPSAKAARADSPRKSEGHSAASHHRHRTSFQPRLAFATFRECTPIRPLWPGAFWDVTEGFASYRTATLASQKARAAYALEPTDDHRRESEETEKEKVKTLRKFYESLRTLLFVASGLALVWRCVTSAARLTGQLFQRDPETAPAPIDNVDLKLLDRVKTRASTNGIGGVLSGAHRGAIVVSYLFAALAVICAVSGGLLTGDESAHQSADTAEVVADSTERSEKTESTPAHDHTKPHAGSGWHRLSIAVAVGEIALICAMWALAKCAASENWHAAWSDNRILAEALRIMPYLGPLGVHTPIPRLPYYLRGSSEAEAPQRMWSIWYFRALLRMAPLRFGTPLSHEQLSAWRVEFLRDLVGAQQRYHEKNAAKQHWSHDYVELLSKWLFGAVFISALAHLVLILLGKHLPFLHAAGLFVCVVGPALIASLHGYAAQMDITRLRLRSDSMARLLAERRATIGEMDLVANPDSAEVVWGLTTVALDVTGLLMDESAGWSLIYRYNNIHAG